MAIRNDVRERALRREAAQPDQNRSKKFYFQVLFADSRRFTLHLHTNPVRNGFNKRKEVIRCLMVQQRGRFCPFGSCAPNGLQP